MQQWQWNVIPMIPLHSTGILLADWLEMVIVDLMRRHVKKVNICKRMDVASRNSQQEATALGLITTK